MEHCVVSNAARCYRAGPTFLLSLSFSLSLILTHTLFLYFATLTFSCQWIPQQQELSISRGRRDRNRRSTQSLHCIRSLSPLARTLQGLLRKRNGPTCFHEEAVEDFRECVQGTCIHPLLHQPTCVLPTEGIHTQVLVPFPHPPPAHTMPTSVCTYLRIPHVG
ncbi:hypothetical protein LX36DRAFT_87467 [Colletotrichum falcatum]|nr:hypothetical protein LX36DRAFT_87467 [Colletotrichum falcatum]